MIKLNTKYHCIMLVDDNELDLMINEELIKMNNLTEKVISFKDPFNALRFLQSTFTSPALASQLIPDLIFLDIDMPKMNGFNFLEEFGKLPPGIAEKIDIVMLSSSVNYIDQMNSLNSPYVKGYLVKPFNINKLQPERSMPVTR